MEGCSRVEANTHRIKEVKPCSIAEEMELEPGDIVLEIDGQKIIDIFDYHYYTDSEYFVMLVEKANGEQWELEIDKDETEDMGIIFENGLMDSYRSCANKCIFCFIDQNPPGMRDTIYFKDDDSRLSFLQGNYVTLTNLSARDIDRIIKYRLGPINVSVHTTNPELRCMMLGNKFAGEALKKMDRFYEAGIPMNGQLVVCPGINDGEELKRTIEDLMKYMPIMRSVSAVPVGLTRYREGLYPLRTFTSDEAREVVEIIEHYQQICFEKEGFHFIHGSDEWYLLAGLPLPEEERYDGYNQIENGVGILRLFYEEFMEALDGVISKGIKCDSKKKITVVSGKLPEEFLGQLASKVMEEYPTVEVVVKAIRNDFFGEKITVSGLVTGQDIVAQLAGENLGDKVILPACMFKANENIFLDDMTFEEVQAALGTKTIIVPVDGGELLKEIIYE